MLTFDQFRTKWEGKRVDYDGSLGYQCVDLIRQYFLECFNLPAGGGVPTAIAYWTNTPSEVLRKFVRVADGSVQKGDVIMLRTFGRTDYEGDGHIMIATGNGDPNSVEALEQNGVGSGTGLGQDAIRTRYVARNRLAGVLRPIQAAPAAPPYTMDVRPFPVRERYRVKPGMHKWDLDRPTFTDIAISPVGVASNNPNDPTYIWVSDRLTRSDIPQYIYYLEDGNLHHGWNSADLELSPLPYVPPAPPVVAQSIEKYALITQVMRFATDTDALHRQNYQGDLGEGQYIVINKNGKAYNLTDDNRYDRQWWVNIDDNKIPEPVVPTLPVDPPPAHDEPVDFPPVIETPKIVTYALKNGQVVLYEATNTQPVPIVDYSGQKDTFNMLPYNYNSRTGKNELVPLVSTFTVNGKLYGRTQKVAKEGWFYGVPMEILELHVMPELPQQPAMLPTATHSTPHVSSFDTNKDGKVSVNEVIEGISGYIWTPAKDMYTKAITPLVPKVEQAKQRITKSIDGFNRKGKS